MISYLVGKLHVSTSDREVIRFLRNKMKKQMRGRKMRDVRHSAFREGLMVHHHNQVTYRAVMSGNFGLMCPKTCTICNPKEAK